MVFLKLGIDCTRLPRAAVHARQTRSYVYSVRSSIEARQPREAVDGRCPSDTRPSQLKEHSTLKSLCRGTKNRSDLARHAPSSRAAVHVSCSSGTRPSQLKEHSTLKYLWRGTKNCSDLARHAPSSRASVDGRCSSDTRPSQLKEHSTLKSLCRGTRNCSDLARHAPSSLAAVHGRCSSDTRTSQLKEHSTLKSLCRGTKNCSDLARHAPSSCPATWGCWWTLFLRHKTVSTEGAQHTEIPLPRDKELLWFGSTRAKFSGGNMVSTLRGKATNFDSRGSRAHLIPGLSLCTFEIPSPGPIFHGTKWLFRRPHV
jgi:hypothetical protein